MGTPSPNSAPGGHRPKPVDPLELELEQLLLEYDRRKDENHSDTADIHSTMKNPAQRDSGALDPPVVCKGTIPDTIPDRPPPDGCISAVTTNPFDPALIDVSYNLTLAFAALPPAAFLTLQAQPPATQVQYQQQNNTTAPGQLTTMQNVFFVAIDVYNGNDLYDTAVIPIAKVCLP